VYIQFWPPPLICSLAWQHHLQCCDVSRKKNAVCFGGCDCDIGTYTEMSTNNKPKHTYTHTQEHRQTNTIAQIHTLNAQVKLMGGQEEAALHNPKGELESIATRLCTLMSTLHELPAIRYRPLSLGLARTVYKRRI
jgi:hypothetical protein